VRIVVVGGSASNVGKTGLATYLLRREPTHAKVAMKVSVREQPCDTRVIIVVPGEEVGRKRDTIRLLEAGATHVVWVTVHRPNVRSGLAAGLREVRRLHPEVVVIESTSAGIEMRSKMDSWFVAGEGPWKPWADKHRARADHILSSAEVFTLLEEAATTSP
jgi:molybdopterin-guanine dinucleotide biosynthesis protein